MKTFESAMQLGTDISNLCAEIFITKPPQDAFSFRLEDNGGEEGDGFSIVFDWCAIDTGYPVEKSTLVETRTVAGYRVWVGVMHSGGHWEPDYMDDVTRCETLNRTQAICFVLEEYVSWRMEQIAEAAYADNFILEEM